jgi:hypothetical protein
MKMPYFFLVTIVCFALIRSYAASSGVQKQSPDPLVEPGSKPTSDASQHSRADDTQHKTNATKDSRRTHVNLSKAERLPFPTKMQAPRISPVIDPRPSNAVTSDVTGKRPVRSGTANNHTAARPPGLPRSSVLTGTGARHGNNNPAIITGTVGAKSANRGSLSGSEMVRRR